MNITLRPVDDTNRDAILALSVREDQPFVAPNAVSLREANEANAGQPGAALPVLYEEKPLIPEKNAVFSLSRSAGIRKKA